MNVTREIAGGTNTRRVGSPRHTERTSAVRIRKDFGPGLRCRRALAFGLRRRHREWTRTDGSVTEAKVGYEVPAESETTVRTDCRSA
jgi:hypothetical protein